MSKLTLLALILPYFPEKKGYLCYAVELFQDRIADPPD